MFELDKETIYQWLNDYEGFSYEFKRHCIVISQALGLDCRFDEGALRSAHEKWGQDCELWRTQHFADEADALSHLKVIALLLYHLSLSPYVGALFDHDFRDDVKYNFNGDDNHKKTVRDDIISAREVVFSLDFCINLIMWYEERRIDRVGPAEFRMTRDLRHDIISYLLSRECDRRAIYLILKALFIRPALQS